jgi:hypothetical protein
VSTSDTGSSDGSGTGPAGATRAAPVALDGVGSGVGQVSSNPS